MKLSKTIRILVWTSFVFYCLILIKLLFLDMRIQYSYSVLWNHINLVPFKTFYDYIVKITTGRINTDVAVRNLVGNLVVFFPMGCYLPCLFRKLGKAKRFCLMMTGMLVGVELLQLLHCIGSFDIDDILFNFGGAMAGFGIVHIPAVHRLLKKLQISGSGEKNS